VILEKRACLIRVAANCGIGQFPMFTGDVAVWWVFQIENAPVAVIHIHQYLAEIEQKRRVAATDQGIMKGPVLYLPLIEIRLLPSFIFKLAQDMVAGQHFSFPSIVALLNRGA
jgi:hypothetical protein